MTQSQRTLRVCTYNIHKCKGLDRRTRPERIASVIAELDADIVALQEVATNSEDYREARQAFLEKRIPLFKGR